MKMDVGLGSVGNPLAKPVLNNDIPKLKDANPGLAGAEQKDFGQVLAQRVDGADKDTTARSQSERGIQFSSHAIERMAQRGIELSSQDMQKIKDALSKVDQKGARESLILSEKGAFIVNVKDKKVITAIDPQSARDSTFMNIDSTVII